MHEILPVRLCGVADKGFLLRVLRQDATDCGGCQVKCLAGIGVELHFDRLLTASVDVDRGDPVDIFQVGTYLLLHEVTDTVGTTRTAHLQRHEAAAEHRDVYLLYLYRETFGQRRGCLVDLLL